MILTILLTGGNNMSNHDMAILTYEALQKRKVEKERKKQKDVDSYIYAATSRCAKLCCSLHTGKGARKGKAPSSY